ncbi:SNF2 family N-terminal domain-containing protein [Xylariaceae sp. FL0255]|nr:SNF2 family N-terminal domain-containing protein [Xylariaceae sp. FL0255]
MTGTASAQSQEPHDNSTEPNDQQITQTESAVNLDVNGTEDTLSLKPNGHNDDAANGVAAVQSETNGHDDHAPENDEPPSKRRRTRETTPQKPIRKPKPISPPWKKIEADGPTTFTEGGKRRSGRTNAVPLELQPQGNKRMTRGSLHGLQQTSPPAKQQQRVVSTPNSSTHRRNASISRPPPPPKPTPPAPKSQPRRVSAAAAVSSRPSPRTRKRSPSPSNATSSPKRTLGTRRSSRTRRDSLDINPRASDLVQSPDSRPTRIRFRINKTAAIPIVHPAQVNVLPGQTLPRSKIASDFEEYVSRAPELDVQDGGWLDVTDEGPPYTDEMAEKDAQIILRVETETEPGGLLSEGRSSLFAPEPIEEPPRQWAQRDHLVKQMVNFRKLMVMEHQRHRQTAKRLAEACRDEWVRRQPKSAEQIEAEARQACIIQYKSVIKTLVGTWENVKNEVNKRRLEDWQAAEQKRVKAALNEAVSMSELKLQARRARFDSDDDGEDDEDLEDSLDEADQEEAGSDSQIEDEALDDASASDEVNMSSSDDDEDAKSTVSDEGLTQEQLRDKYANIPDILKDPTPVDDEAKESGSDEVAGVQPDDADDTSDESVDMDDDMGSSDDDSEIEEYDEQDEDEEEDDEPAGLLGLFFGKKELKKLTKDTPIDDNPQPTKDMEMAEVEESKAEHDANQMDPIPISEDTKIGPQTDLPKDSAAESTSLSPPHHNAMDIDADTTDQPVPSDVPSIEIVSAPSDPQQPTPDTEALTNPASRDRSQSQTSDTKPSDVDTASSVTKLDASRSTSPHSQTPKTKTDVPFLLRGTLREYQHYGLDWLAGLYKNHTNGILADEMGLGKTIQTIALLAHLACHHEVWGPHLVIVPTSVMLNWEMEFKKWCPGFKVLSYYGSIEERKRKRQGWKTDDIWNVCITSYQIVLQDQQVFKRRQWHYMILDEAHNIKNFKSKRWQTLLGFNTQARLLLTGTPLQNNLTELWSLLFFLMPSENGVGGFADLSEFQDWFHKPESQILESGREQMDDEARAIIAKLHKVLRPYLLRRLKADVEKQMPAKVEHVEFCRLSRRQRELYDGFLARTDTREALASGNYISVINCLMQLRKVCNHPDLFVERPIMTSFRQPRSVVADYRYTESLLRDKLLQENSLDTINLSFLNMIPTKNEGMSVTHCGRIFELSAHRTLLDLRETQEERARLTHTKLDPSTVESNITFLDNAGRWTRFEELQHCVYVNALRRQQHPVYGKQLTDFLTLDTQRRSGKSLSNIPHKIMSWFEADSAFLHSTILSLDERAASMKTTISKFACITPKVVTRDLDHFVLGTRGIQEFDEMNLKLSAPVRYAPFIPKESPLDPWHESRMRLSIQFPDKRLLQYDCGKLQALDKLLRKLQAGGHRALIFTQMTKVLDILEQFLNIHGHKYLRLDGATKVEQRQILTDRFNNDTRILCFILSTRSGGLGINLTGADTVIFYDQDWNPAMDKQCQDRCHRIGQTRDVHIYRLVSEHTIEANILRKASQKQMLDDIVIQEGGFTTDYFNKMSVRDVMGTPDQGDVVGSAMDRVLGGVETADQRTVGRVLEQAEDREDVAAAHVAEKEIQEDEADFAERPPTTSVSGASSARQGTPATQDAQGIGKSNLGLFAESMDADVAPQEIETNAWGDQIHNVDDYMLRTMSMLLEGTALELPKDKKKSKKGKDTRKR